MVTKFIDIDALDFEYEQVTRDINRVTDTEHALDVIFRYHRKHGFPHYNVPKFQRKLIINKLRQFDETGIFNGDQIQQTMHGLSLAWTYHPHWVDVKCGSSKLKPIEYWNSDEKLREIILKTWNWQLKHGSGTFTLNRLRQNFKIYGGNQSVSNFRPTAAKLIYNLYGNRGVVWDMSCGWGGRLMGFLASDCRRYIGTEPSTKTYDGLLKMADELNIFSKEIELHKSGSEVFRPDRESLDLCFTSPPYFDTEQYSDEPTQSYIKYPSESEWIDGFLTQTIENCAYGLKRGGRMILNIANTPRYKTIEQKTVEIANKICFFHEKTVYLILSSVSGRGVKLEPVFIFKKT